MRKFTTASPREVTCPHCHKTYVGCWERNVIPICRFCGKAFRETNEQEGTMATAAKKTATKSAAKKPAAPRPVAKKETKKTSTTSSTKTTTQSGKAVSEVLNLKNGKARPQGKRGTHGKTTGLVVHEMWMKLLRENYKAHLSDERIAKLMRAEFPTRKEYSADDVRAHRSIWNQGRFTDQAEKPAHRLQEFDEHGEPVSGREKQASARVASAKRTKKDPDAVEV